MRNRKPVYVGWSGTVDVGSNVPPMSVFEITIDTEDNLFEFSILTRNSKGGNENELIISRLMELYQQDWLKIDITIPKDKDGGILVIPTFIGVDLSIGFDSPVNPYDFRERVVISGKIATGHKAYINRNDYVRVL